MPATASKAAKPVEDEDDFGGFLSEEQVEAVAEDSKASKNYVQVNKLEEGKAHRFRYIGPGITGFEGWTETDGKRKPVRFKLKPNPIPDYIAPDKQGNVDVKRFTAGVVWDYQDEQLKILSFTQRTLLSSLAELIKDKEDHGDPQKYDIKITRTGSGTDTKYTMVGGQYRPIPEEALEAYKAATIDLSALFDGRDPFNPDKKAADGALDDDD